MTREKLIEYIEWNKRMIVEFTEMERREDTWPMELRECNYHDSVMRCTAELTRLENLLVSGNYDPIDTPCVENEMFSE